MAKQRQSLLTHCLNCNHSLVSHFHTSDWGKVGACQKTRAEGSWRCTCPMFEPDRRSGQTITVTIKPDVERFKETLGRIGAEFNKWLKEQEDQDKRFTEFWEEVEKEHENQRVEESTRYYTGHECGRCKHEPGFHFTAPEEVGNKLNWCARCGSVEKICGGYIRASSLHPWPPPMRPECEKCEHPYPAHLEVFPNKGGYEGVYIEKGCHMVLGVGTEARECSCVGYQPKKIKFQVERRGF